MNFYLFLLHLNLVLQFCRVFIFIYFIFKEIFTFFALISCSLILGEIIYYLLLQTNRFYLPLSLYSFTKSLIYSPFTSCYLLLVNLITFFIMQIHLLLHYIHIHACVCIGVLQSLYTYMHIFLM